MFFSSYLSMFFLFTVTFQSLSHAKDLSLESGTAQTPLIELYSSEGCSSCPPADRWLASLKNNPQLWKSFIPIEFHVDYWNDLGWVDVFSHKQFTKRQRKYSREWKAPKVYTPGFILNGREWPLGQQKISHIKKSNEVGKLVVKQSKGHVFNVTFSPLSRTRKGYKVYAALLGHGLKTKVKAGENIGATLNHEFVALALNSKILRKKNGNHLATLSLPQESKASPKSYSVAFWVTNGESQSPIQAVGGYLTP